MQFKVKSQDTLNDLVLHDCFINHTEWVNNSLIFYLDWVEVLKTHPFNETGKAKQARNAALIFESAVEISCVYLDKSKSKEGGDNIENNCHNIISNCKDVEIFSSEEIVENGQKKWKCICDYFEFTISYSIMWVCFNELGEDSWLEFQPE